MEKSNSPFPRVWPVPLAPFIVMHDKILNRWIRDFEREGYKIMGSKIIYGGRRAAGEIDLLMYNGYDIICEVKSSYRNFEKGLSQLRRTDEYFNRHFEKYLIVNDYIYYLF